MLGKARFCSKCGAAAGAAVPPGYLPAVPEKSAAVAAILASLISGVGHIYVGKVKQGILFLATILGFDILIAAVMFILLMGLRRVISSFAATILIWSVDIFLLGNWMYQIWDAARSAREYNRLNRSIDQSTDLRGRLSQWIER